MHIFDFSLAGPRLNNQDSTLASIVKNKVLALVADGVGGIEGGRAASSCVRQAALHALENNEFDPLGILELAHVYVNQLTLTKAATTASILCIDNFNLVFAHTGDSRIYVLRGTGLKTLTIDQTEVALLLREGVLTKKDAENYHRRNVLTHAIEKGQALVPQVGTFELKPNDRVILLSDGVYKLLNKSNICDISLQSDNVDKMGTAIIERIKHHLVDDASMVVIEM